MLLPGVIDPECHLGGHRPLADDMVSETRAAAATGVTTWGMMLNSAMMAPPPGGIQAADEIPTMAQAIPHLLATESAAMIDFFLSPIITTDAQADEIPTLAREHGITSFKFHLQMAGPWGRQAGGPQTAYNFDDGTVYAAVRRSRRWGRQRWCCFTVRTGRLPGCCSGGWRRRGGTTWAPGTTIHRGLRKRAMRGPICTLRGDRLPGVHRPLHDRADGRGGQRARQAGVQVTSQVGMHYLVLNKDAWRINVPLRDAATHEALWRALASGEIDCIGSDHVAHLRTREAMETGNVWTTISGFPSRVEGCSR